MNDDKDTAAVAVEHPSALVFLTTQELTQLLNAVANSAIPGGQVISMAAILQKAVALVNAGLPVGSIRL